MFLNLSANLINLAQVFGPLSPSFKDIFDVLFTAFLIYAFLVLLKRAHAFYILGGIGILFAIYVAAIFFNLRLTALVFHSFFSFFVLILVIIFQKELRRFFEWVSTWGRIYRDARETLSDIESAHIIKTVNFLLKKKIGALIVITGNRSIDQFLEGGVVLDGRISSPLLKSIFDPSSPGHDGAVVIDNGRIKRFSVHLPLAERFSNEFGTRHRAALGLSERTDAFVIVVSEERGVVSVAHQGTLKELSGAAQLKDLLDNFNKRNERSGDAMPWHGSLTENLREKIMALLIAILLWLIFGS